LAIDQTPFQKFLLAYIVIATSGAAIFISVEPRCLFARLAHSIRTSHPNRNLPSKTRPWGQLSDFVRYSLIKPEDRK